MSVFDGASNTPKTSRRLSLSQKGLLIFCALMAFLIAGNLWAHQDVPGSSKPSLVNLGLEDLMKIEVTSVSNRPERLLDAAASIYVITAQNIRRPSVPSLPHTFRLTPHLPFPPIT